MLRPYTHPRVHCRPDQHVHCRPDAKPCVWPRVHSEPSSARSSPPRRNESMNGRAPRASRSGSGTTMRSEEHTSELQSPCNLVCRLLLEKKKNNYTRFEATHWDAERMTTHAASPEIVAFTSSPPGTTRRRAREHAQH